MQVLSLNSKFCSYCCTQKTTNQHLLKQKRSLLFLIININNNQAKSPLDKIHGYLVDDHELDSPLGYVIYVTYEN
jgi:hypothetical protein